MRRKNNQLQKYYGIVQFAPRPGNTEFKPGVIGAFSNVATLARSEEEYRAIVTKDLEADNFDVIEITYVELLQDALDDPDVREKIGNVYDELSDQFPVIYGDCYTYPSEDE